MGALCAFRRLEVKRYGWFCVTSGKLPGQCHIAGVDRGAQQTCHRLAPMKLDPVPSATAETVGPTESGCVSVSDEAHDTRNISSPFPPPSDAPTVHHSLEQLNGTSGRSDDAATSSVGSMIGSTSARSAAPGPSQAADVQPPSCETPLVGGEVEEVLEKNKIKKELAELVPKVEQSAGEGGAQAGGLAAQH
eukprot:gene26115-20174_t